MIWVEGATHAGEYRLRLRFNDGTEGTVDLREIIFDDLRPVFQQARDPEVFRRFRVDMDTVVWEHGLDLAPEFLYDLIQAAEAAPVVTAR
jgi:hypothetical protein